MIAPQVAMPHHAKKMFGKQHCDAGAAGEAGEAGEAGADCERVREPESRPGFTDSRQTRR